MIGERKRGGLPVAGGIGPGNGQVAPRGQNDEVFVYPIRASAEQVRSLFVEMLERADGLRRAPEFYNTLTNNCTTAILRHVNRIAPEPIPYGLRILLPGYSDALAHERGLVATELSLDAARARYRVDERARRFQSHPRFSTLIRHAESTE